MYQMSRLGMRAALVHVLGKIAPFRSSFAVMKSYTSNVADDSGSRRLFALITSSDDAVLHPRINI